MRVAALLLLAAQGCGSGIDVRGGGADPNYNFERLKTYSWSPRDTGGDPRIDEALLDQRVHAGVDNSLGAKGYRLEPEGGDFLVGYRAVLGRQREVEPRQPFEGIWTDDHRPRSAGDTSAPVSKVVTEGTLVLRIFDGKTGNLVWEAAADTEINPKQGPLSLAPTNEDKVRIAIRKMLERFPP